MPAGSLSGVHVEGTVEDRYEEAVLLACRAMMHNRVRREVTVGAGPKDLSVGLQLPLQHDDRVGGGVGVALCRHARGVPDEVVLGA